MTVNRHGLQRGLECEVNDRKAAIVCYFSYTGNTRKVAARLSERLMERYDVDHVEIQPEHQRRYIVWLAYSFIPRSRVSIRRVVTDLSGYDLICLGCPKWTFSCPPFNQYLGLMSGCEGKKVVFFTTFGGFREKSFIDGIVRELSRRSVGSVSILAVKRRSVTDGSYVQIVDNFSIQFLLCG